MNKTETTGRKTSFPSRKAGRHALQTSLDDLEKKLNRRLAYDLLLENMDPDLVYDEIVILQEAFDGLNFPYINNEIYDFFDQIEEETKMQMLHSYLENNISILMNYLDTPPMKVQYVKADPEDKAIMDQAEKSICSLWEEVNLILYKIPYIHKTNAKKRAEQLEATMDQAAYMKLIAKPEEPKVIKITRPNVKPEWRKYETQGPIESGELEEEKLQKSVPLKIKIENPKAQADSEETAHLIKEKPESSDNTPPSSDNSRKPEAEKEGERTITITERTLGKVITLIALAMIVLGGILGFALIMPHLDVAMSTLVFYAFLWALVLLNLVFFFAYFASRMLHFTLKQHEGENAGIFREYPYIWWTDLILAAVLIFIAWFNAFGGLVGRSWMGAIYSAMPTLFLILGTILLIYCFYRMFIWLYMHTVNPGESYITTGRQLKNWGRAIASGFKKLMKHVQNLGEVKQPDVDDDNDSELDSVLEEALKDQKDVWQDLQKKEKDPDRIIHLKIVDKEK